MAALSRLGIAAHKATEQGDRLDAAHLANLRECVRILRELASMPDPLIQRQTRSITAGVNVLFASGLAVARTPELAPILIELALIEHSLDPTPERILPGCTSLHYFQMTPLRLALAGEWDACAATLDAVDRVVRERNLTLDPSDIRDFALARAELALHRGAVDGPEPRRVQALAILDAALSTDVAVEDPYTAHSSFVAAVDRHATLASELGIRDAVAADLGRITDFIRAIEGTRVPKEFALQVGERVALLLRAMAAE